MEFRQCPRCRCMKNIRKNRTMCIRCEREFNINSHKISKQNNIHPTKQTIQKGRGDVLNKDVDSVASVESKTGDLNSRRRTG